MLYALLSLAALLIVLAALHVISERIAAVIFLLLSSVVYFAWISPNLRRSPKGGLKQVPSFRKLRARLLVVSVCEMLLRRNATR
jgi:hypothetical protein